MYRDWYMLGEGYLLRECYLLREWYYVWRSAAGPLCLLLPTAAAVQRACFTGLKPHLETGMA